MVGVLIMAASLKMTPEHYAQMKALLDDMFIELGKPIGHFIAAYESIGKTAKAFRWDCLYATSTIEREQLIPELYKYLEDSHIDSGLRCYFRSR